MSGARDLEDAKKSEEKKESVMATADELRRKKEMGFAEAAKLFSHESPKKLYALREGDLREFVKLIHLDLLDYKAADYHYSESTPQKIAGAIGNKSDEFKMALKEALKEKYSKVVKGLNDKIAKQISKTKTTIDDMESERDKLILTDKSVKHYFVYVLEKALRKGESYGQVMKIINDELKKYPHYRFDNTLIRARKAINGDSKLFASEEHVESKQKPTR